MLSIHRPDSRQIEAFLLSLPNLAFSYPEVGWTLTSPPAGYRVDHNRVQLGYGQNTFRRAIDAIRRWQMFDLTWIEIQDNQTPIRIGSNVGVLARHYGFWSLNACRIVYCVEDDSPIHRYGFAYGTLTEHAERGEERFTVEWRPDDDSVWYDILAFSRPNSRLVRIGYPFARRLQKRFARDSKAAMHRVAST